MLSLVPQYAESDPDDDASSQSSVGEPPPVPLAPLSPPLTLSIHDANEPGFNDKDIYDPNPSNTAEMDAFCTQIEACNEFVPSPGTNDGQIFASPPWKIQGVAAAGPGSVMLVFCASLTKQGRKGPQRGVKAEGEWTVVKTNTIAHVVCARGVRIKCRFAPISL